jgi:hypothetical protein
LEKLFNSNFWIVLVFIYILILFKRSFFEKKYLLNYEFYYLGTLVAYYIIPVFFLFLNGGPENIILGRLRKNWFDSIIHDYWVPSLLIIVFPYLIAKKWKLLPKLEYTQSQIPFHWAVIALIISLLQSFQLFQSETHGDSFALIAKLPLIVQQLLKLLNFIVIPMWVLLTVYTVNKRSLSWYLILLFIILLNFTPYGSRGQTVFQILTLLIVFSAKNGMPNRLKFTFIAFFGFTIFMFLGFFRAEYIGSFVTVVELLVSGDIPFYLGELDQIFANAVEIFNFQYSNSLNIPFNVRITEQFALLPSQLLPFEKVTYLDWYLNEYYPIYKENGGGWAFGTMAFIGTFDNYLYPIMYLIEMWFLIYVLFNKTSLLFPVWFKFPLQIFIFSNLMLIHRSSPLIVIWSTIQAIFTLFLLFMFINLLTKTKIHLLP